MNDNGNVYKKISSQCIFGNITQDDLNLMLSASFSQ